MSYVAPGTASSAEAVLGLIWERISRRRFTATVVSAALVCGVVAALSSTRFFRIVERNGFDRLVGAQPPPKPAAQIVFVDITDATVKETGDWPIPRDQVAVAIDQIVKGRPELIGLDMHLSEPRLPEQDQALAEALEAAGNVIIATSRNERGIWAEPLPEFRQGALDVGFVSFYLDEDGAVRRVPLFLRLREGDGKTIEVLGFATALATNYLGEGPTPGRAGRVRLGDREIDVEGGRGEVPTILLGAWRPPGLRLDLLDVLQEGFDPNVVEGDIVLIGESSQAAKDRFTTPLYASRGLVSGAEIHAAALATLLEGGSVRVLGEVPRTLADLLAALLALGLVMYGRPAWAVPTVLAMGLGIFALAFWLLAARQVWMPFVSTESALLLSLSAALGYRFLRGDEQERRLRELFGRYVSDEVLKEVFRHPEDVVIEGQERTASILFADIRGFTARSAGQPPREVIAWVNDYFAAMSEVIERHGGFLNKFIGDGLMVLFGVPVSRGVRDDAERAVRAGLQMLERLETLNRDNRSHAERGLWRPPIRIGIGIHTGTLAAGSVGSPRRMEYSVIGEAVNLAARLESATRHFDDVDLVISPATEALVRERFVTEALGAAEAKGFSQQVQVYTVRAERPETAGGLPR
jgi:adenylate cyclase